MCVRGIEYASTIFQLDIPTVYDGAIFKHILLNSKRDLLLYNMFVFMDITILIRYLRAMILESGCEYITFLAFDFQS
jgi:hypothetical protein